MAPDSLSNILALRRPGPFRRSKNAFRFFDLPPELRRCVIDHLKPHEFMALVFACYDFMRLKHSEIVPPLSLFHAIGIHKNTGKFEPDFWVPNGWNENPLAKGMLPNEVLLNILRHLHPKDQINFAIAAYPMLHWRRLVQQLDLQSYMRMLYAANPALQ
ncbi:hypothetical protein P152DRAFT_73166 [Eremomyces bilateralis CBS 781.70]|uniref:F-box domain-containing protein n=1 Tax=Eremomyces bilateralis CBS 781.70 TaxID=1392243 RepID=A0A6G1FZ78_9PEZI|nr:uncharacterized protein P152DRAFT_73166 [Eremomyces bilateralis CBS 781.70]KAF1810980.1 hypothetical protein P152DRAFT_73166 [Eremomyces bilateralis CBS 781.70]